VKKKSILLRILLFFLLSINAFLLQAQLTVNTSMTPTQLVQNVLVGTGVTVSNVTYTGGIDAIGQFTTGSSPTNLGLSSGVIMSSGVVNGSPAIGSSSSNQQSGTNGGGSDADLLNLVPGYTINDASVLQFDFIPLSDTIKFRYVFGSEEYPEWVGSFNDVFGFFVSGPNPLGGSYVNKNIALIPGTNVVVSINNVNAGSYATYFVDNLGMGGTTIVYDGFTTVLTAWCLVVPCIQYHIKLAIGDANDTGWDSGVFLEANSFSGGAVAVNQYPAVPIAGNNAIEGCNDITLSFNLQSLQAAAYTVSYSIMGTATNGVDYTAIPNSVTIPAGQDSVNLIIHPFMDGITEGTETIILLVQTSICGNNDTVLVTIMDNTPLIINTSNDTTICGGQATIWGYASGGIIPYTYSWSNSAGNTPVVTVSPVVTTNYTISVTDLCGTIATEDINITYGQGSAEAGNDVTLCLGESTTLVASGGNGYLWNDGTTTAINNVNPTVTTVYYVTASGTCDGYDSVTVFVNPLPTITATSSASSIFLGFSVNLYATGGTIYQWSSSPYDPSLASQANSASPTVSPQSTTTYNVVAYDANGCSGSASVVVIVVPVYPEVNFSGYPLKGCEPLIVQFMDSTIKALPGATYFWDFGNGTTSTLINPEAYYPEHGIYDVSLTVTNPNGFGMTLVSYACVEVYPVPIAVFQTLPNREVSILESTIGFFDETVGDPVKWSWSFGDGDTSDLQNIYHVYQDTGHYQVILVATNQYGCFDTAQTTISVRPDYYMFVPNAFTPNGDGKNDVFLIQGQGFLEDSYVIRIFNRWGEEVFFSKNINESWDGICKGKKALGETYVYVINFIDQINHTHEIKGALSVYR
jgi:gliding motility-associated-like protein